jgi:enoyl-CoA hydratase/carnithine racemase
MATDDVLIERRDDRVATLTLNRPERKNALTLELVSALTDALRRASEDDEVRCVVLTGAGGAFCSGADLKAAMGRAEPLAGVEEALGGYHDLIRAVVGAPKPVIASVDGPAVGFGCDLALACDIRVLSARAYLQEKFVRIGLMPDGGGTLWLTRMIGIGRALELLLTGDPIEAERALELGIANRVVPHGELEAQAGALAARLAKGPPLAHAAIKGAVRAALASTIEDALAREREGQLRCLRSQDFMEGVGAWMQGREPEFTGE